MADHPVVFDKHLASAGKASSVTAVSQPPANPSGGGTIDPLVVAFYLLMEVANTTCQSAIIHSKQLASNAKAQQMLNNEAAQLQWYSVPKLDSTKHREVISDTTHFTWAFWKHDAFLYTTCKTKTFVTHKNQTQVDNAMAKNQRVAAQRQIISDRLTLLQQTAQVGETNVNTSVNESMQSMQEGTDLLHILLSLTFKALLRQQPQP